MYTPIKKTSTTKVVHLDLDSTVQLFVCKNLTWRLRKPTSGERPILWVVLVASDFVTAPQFLVAVPSIDFAEICQIAKFDWLVRDIPPLRDNTPKHLKAPNAALAHHTHIIIPIICLSRFLDASNVSCM